MKISIVTATGCVLFGISIGAAEESTFKFGGQRIGIPPLSLAESVANGAAAANSHPFGTEMPRSMDGTDAPQISPKLVPPILPPTMRKQPQQARQVPNVSRASGMPILIPSEAVDYKMTVVPPDPNVDFKLVIKDPAAAAGQVKAPGK